MEVIKLLVSLSWTKPHSLKIIEWETSKTNDCDEADTVENLKGRIGWEYEIQTRANGPWNGGLYQIPLFHNNVFQFWAIFEIWKKCEMLSFKDPPFS